MTQLLIDRATLEQCVEDVLEINRAIGKGGVAYDINIRAYPAIERALKALRAALANAKRVEPEPKLWLWKNFVDGKQEYWVFDNLYPININDGDPQTLGDPCGYALFKPSRNGRKDTPE